MVELAPDGKIVDFQTLGNLKKLYYYYKNRNFEIKL